MKPPDVKNDPVAHTTCLGEAVKNGPDPHTTCVGDGGKTIFFPLCIKLFNLLVAHNLF